VFVASDARGGGKKVDKYYYVQDRPGSRRRFRSAVEIARCALAHAP